MQRNKTAYTNAHALNESLASPVLDDLRADVRRAPPAEGHSIHYPMKGRVSGHAIRGTSISSTRRFPTTLERRTVLGVVRRLHRKNECMHG